MNAKSRDVDLLGHDNLIIYPSHLNHVKGHVSDAV